MIKEKFNSGHPRQQFSASIRLGDGSFVGSCCYLQLGPDRVYEDPRISRPGSLSVQLRNLTEVVVVVGELEIVYACAGKHEQIRKRRRDASATAAPCQPRGQFPDRLSNRMTQEEQIELLEGALLGVARDAAP